MIRQRVDLATRRRAARVGHTATPTMRLQRGALHGDIRVATVIGSEKCTDKSKKHASSVDVCDHRKTFGLNVMSVTSNVALKSKLVKIGGWKNVNGGYRVP